MEARAWVNGKSCGWRQGFVAVKGGGGERSRGNQVYTGFSFLLFRTGRPAKKVHFPLQ